MDIKSIIKSIVEKKLEKDSDDPCWDGYVQLGTKKKGGKEVPNCVPKESVELDEAKTDVYHKHMLKALGKSKLPKNHSFTSAIADNGDFIVRDGAGRVVGRIPKAEHDLKESTKLTEDVHNDLNAAIIEFQKKLMKMSEHLDPTIAEEVTKLDESLDELRAGTLFKSRSGR
jgi:hypothetical protein